MKKLFVLFLLLAVLLAGCSADAPQETEIFAMDTLISLRLWGGSEDTLRALSQELYRLEALFSATDEQCPVYQLNLSGAASPAPEFAALLRASLSLSEETGGAFDPTVYPLVKAWGFPDKSYRVPEADELSALLACVGTQHVHFDGTSVSLDGGCQLDFGAIAKGYAAEHCAQLLQEQGVEAALLSLGGNVQTLGTKPDGSSWVIGIANPEEPGSAIATLTFSGSMALVTSGSYQRAFTRDGVTYHHILDPKTGYPAESGLASVTVLCDSGTRADAYSTALFVMGLAEGTAFYRQQGDFEAVFITREGEIHATEGCAPMLGGCSFQVIARETEG